MNQEREDKDIHADIGNSKVQKMIARIEVGNPSIVGVDFVMLKDWRMQVMEVPKVVVNIGNPKERVHGWSRAHMVLINNDSSRLEIGCSLELELDLEYERGEDSSFKTFCSRETMCMRYLTFENEAKGLQTLWKSSLIQGEFMELVPNVQLVCI